MGLYKLEEQSDQVCTVCDTTCIFSGHYAMVEALCSNFKVITATLRVFETLGKSQ